MDSKLLQAIVASGIGFFRFSFARRLHVAGIVIACGLAACGEKPNLLQPPADFWGLTTAQTKADITRLKGAPARVAPVSPMNPAGELWIYPPKDADPKILADGELPFDSYLVHFRGEKVSRIEFYGRTPATAPAVLGLRAGDSLDDLTRRLGAPSSVAKSADQLSAVVSYERFRLFFGIRQNQVEAYGLYNPEFGPVEISKQD
jgi:hypothetical protein